MAIPVPESELPLMLPDTENFKPSGSGEGPLANVTEWAGADTQSIALQDLKLRESTQYVCESVCVYSKVNRGWQVNRITAEHECNIRVRCLVALEQPSTMQHNKCSP